MTDRTIVKFMHNGIAYTPSEGVPQEEYDRVVSELGDSNIMHEGVKLPQVQIISTSDTIDEVTLSKMGGRIDGGCYKISIYYTTPAYAGQPIAIFIGTKKPAQQDFTHANYNRSYRRIEEIGDIYKSDNDVIVFLKVQKTLYGELVYDKVIWNFSNNTFSVEEGVEPTVPAGYELINGANWIKSLSRPVHDYKYWEEITLNSI